MDDASQELVLAHLRTRAAEPWLQHSSRIPLGPGSRLLCVAVGGPVQAALARGLRAVTVTR